MGCSRAIYAMAASGMLPAFLAEIHPRYHTPWKAIWCIGILTMLSPLVGRSLLVWLIDAGGFMFVITNCIVAHNGGRGLCDVGINTPQLRNNLFFQNRISLLHYRGSELRNAGAV